MRRDHGPQADYIYIYNMSVGVKVVGAYHVIVAFDAIPIESIRLDNLCDP